MNKMKKTIINILATTCAVILLIVVVGIISNGGISFLFNEDANIHNSVFFQILGANILIHFGLFFTRKFESKYAVLEFSLDISFIIIVLLVLGLLFKWYIDKLWVLAIMAIVLYIFGLLTDMVRIRKDIDDINKLLKKRKERES